MNKVAPLLQKIWIIGDSCIYELYIAAEGNEYQ